MPLFEQHHIHVKRVFTQGADKQEIRQDDDGAELEGLARHVDGNPEKGRNMDKEDIQIFHQILIVGVQNDFKAAYRCHDVQGKGREPYHRI